MWSELRRPINWQKMLNKKLLENEVKCEGVAAREARRQTEREKCVKWNEWAVV